MYRHSSFLECRLLSFAVVHHSLASTGTIRGIIKAIHVPSFTNSNFGDRWSLTWHQNILKFDLAASISLNKCLFMHMVKKEAKNED